MSFRNLVPALILAISALTLPAEAYIGPGAGAGTIAVVLGVLASIVLGFFAILWYPFKRMLKKRKAAKEAAAPAASASEQEADSGPAQN